MKKLFILLCVVAGIVLFSCNKKGNEFQEKKEKKIVSLAQKAEIKTLDPQKSTDSISARVIFLTTERLFSINENGEIENELAELVKEINSTNFNITIKKDIFFSNGESLTIDDVIFSLERARILPSTAKDFEMIKSIEKVDEYSLKITTSHVAGNLFNKLASKGASVISKKVFEKNENNIVGSGMFVVKEWISGDRIILDRNPYYKKSNSNIDELVIRFIPEANNRSIVLETGEIDISTELSPLDYRRITEEKYNTMENETPSTLFLGFDLRNPLLEDKRVRQAIAYAIDNQSFVDVVFNGSASPATSAVPKVTTGHTDNVKIYKQDIEKAKELLKEAGYPNGFKIDLYVNEDSQRVDMAIIIQDNLKKIGIDVEIKIYQWASFISTIENSDIMKPLFLLSFNIYDDNAEDYLYPLFHSSQIESRRNVIFFKNNKFDKLIDEARLLLDLKKRNALYEEAQQIIQEELPHYTLVYPKRNVAYSNRIENFKMDKNGYYIFKDTIVK